LSCFIFFYRYLFSTCFFSLLAKRAATLKVAAKPTTRQKKIDLSEEEEEVEDVEDFDYEGEESEEPVQEQEEEEEEIGMLNSNPF
jgi:hypothetical protein